MRKKGDNQPQIIKRRELVLQLHTQKVCPVLIHEALLKKKDKLTGQLEYPSLSLKTIYRDIEYIERELAKEVKRLGKGALKKRQEKIIQTLLTSIIERQKFLWGVARDKKTSREAIAAVGQVREEEKWMIQFMEKLGLLPTPDIGPLIVNNIAGGVNAREIYKNLSEEERNELVDRLRKASGKFNCQPSED